MWWIDQEPKGNASFLVPVSPPVHFEGVENRDFFSGRAISEQHLSEWVERCSCGQLSHAHSSKEALESEHVHNIFIVHRYMESTCKVVCTVLEFVSWVIAFHFMPKDFHFACVHTFLWFVSGCSQHTTIVRFRLFSARPPVHVGDYELTGTKKIKRLP